jgi:hypothetical protein
VKSANSKNVLILCNKGSYQALINGGHIRLNQLISLINSIDNCNIEVSTSVTKKIRKKRFDLLICVSYTSIYKASLISSKNRGLLWYDLCDSWMLNLKFFIEHERSVKTLIRFVRDVLARNIAPTPDLISYITKTDQISDNSRFKGPKCFVIPNSSFTPTFQLTNNEGSGGLDDRLFFIGDGNYLPNQIAVDWLEKNVIPLLDVFLGHTYKIAIIGRGYKPSTSPRLLFKGYLQNLEKEIHRGSINLAYCPNPAGMKNKTLLSLNLGLITIGNEHAFNGIEPNSSMIMANDANSFANAIIEHLKTPHPNAINPIKFEQDETGQLITHLKRALIK